jgi:cytochrome c biogenesis protein CcmG/thiol:disulfide interchange protein DsbE
VLYSSLSVAAVIGVLIAVLAAAKPSSSLNSSSPLLGKPAPVVAGPGLNGGGSYSLSQFTGKWVVVNFSASWCVPCRQETPELQAFTAEHAAAGNATVLAVSFDPSDVGHLAAYFRSVHATWPAINDPSAEVGFGVSEIPQSYLVDPSGTVVAKFFGEVTAAGVDKIIHKASTAA